MLALPVNKILPDEGPFAFKRMVRGLILVAEIKGGPSTIENAFQVFKTYVEDHNYTEIALPFQSLITDRQAEPDTAKWVTKLYYPVY
jgi:effector-binding domain-containing protein